MIKTTTAAAIKTRAISMMRFFVLGFTVLSAVFFMAKPWEIFSSISASVKAVDSPTSDGFARNESLCTECGVWIMISQGLWLHFVVAVFFKNRQVSKGALHTPYTQVLFREPVSFRGGTASIEVEIKAIYRYRMFCPRYVWFAHILLVCNRVLFSRELRECMNLFVGFNSKWIRKERVICELEMNFKKIQGHPTRI